MIDAISVRDTNTLELKLNTSKEAANTFRVLQDMQLQERRLGEESLPTHHKITLSDTTILITGESLNFAILLAKKHGLLSQEKGSALAKEWGELVRREEDAQQREKLSQQIANRKGLYAARSLGKPIPQRPKKKGLPDDLKEIIEKQMAQPPLISLIRMK